MRFMARGSLYDINHLIHGYDWKSINNVRGTEVRIGGGQGDVSMALAKETLKPQPHCPEPSRHC
ncbi:hypothetical protein GQ43DRAFT_95674 [Delitschia confertaspora ATCC 74209]|uniref:Uncharacterized protein n=1 Tax=Delitschia confertaspora ATCC 74209 TaxID=1513339 RepID=A0A9P4JXE7_9PLEO|nr:hypothetical protein GQ43DRAFT_95674 [Delitschia confertaspora ATCC 74209]